MDDGLKLIAKRHFFILEADRELVESFLTSDLDGTLAFSLSLFTEFASGTLYFSEEALTWFPSTIFLSLWNKQMSKEIQYMKELDSEYERVKLGEISQ